MRAGWSIDGDRVAYDFSTPPGTAARLKLPANATDIALDGRRLGEDEIAQVLGAGLAVPPGNRAVTLRLTA